MTSYLKYERESLEQEIKTYYSEHKDEITEELFKVPLREFTYDVKSSVNAEKYLNEKGEFKMWRTAQGLARYLDMYIRRFDMDLDKDITLEEAVKKIIP